MAVHERYPVASESLSQIEINHFFIFRFQSQLDRFPPESKGRNTMLALSEGRESWEPSEGESDEEAMPSPMEAAMRKPEMDSVLIQPQVRENRSNRSKYRCPVCETQVWGKPGLLIKCGNTDCDCADYEETS